MAFQFPKIDFTDAKTRVLIIVGGVLGFVGLVYLGVTFFSNSSATSGSSKLAGAPGDLKSVPGGQLSPEYYRALVQANTQAARQAQISGGSAVPTLLNQPGEQSNFQAPTAPNCTVVCPSSENANIEDDINALVKTGKLSPEDGKALIELAKKNVSVSEYAAELNRLVKQGKLTPEQARKLLETYKKQHENTLQQDSGKTMDALIKSGRLSLDTANELLDLQKKKVSPEEYAERLSQLVKEGKISPETAAELLAQYTQQHAKEAAAESIGKLKQMAASGQIAADVAKELAEYQRRSVSPKEYEEELQHLVRQGKLTPEQARQLLAEYTHQIPPDIAEELAGYQKRNVPVAEYEAALKRLVAAGKLTPEQAKQLLEQYRRVKSPNEGESVANDIVKQAEKANEDAVRALAASGKISAETAQKLLDLQKAKVPVDEYKRQLEELVRQGKISPEDAKKLLNSYEQARGAGVQDLLASGRISAETAQKLMNLQKAKVPVDEYKRQLDELVRQGKISPADAKKLLENYQRLNGSAAENVQEALATKKISPETQEKLLALQKASVPVDEYKRQLAQLVREGKISPEEAKRLLDEYQKLHDVRDEADRLSGMRASNMPLDEYANELKRAVAAGILTPEQAARLLQEYKTTKARAVVTPPAPLPNVEGAEDFARLQQKLQAAAPIVAAPAVSTSPEQFTAVSAATQAKLTAQAKADADKQRQLEQQHLQELMAGMSSQAGSLINSWQPPTMSGQTGAGDKDGKAAGQPLNGPASASKGEGATTAAAHSSAPIIKAGTILYAVLDTAANSDYPDSPVMATVVDGKYKGSKLLGKLAITQGQDRVALSFKLMNRDDWESGKAVNAYAIDPDTARTALASEVNYHYFVRYGSLFASSFVAGYASAISSSGSTTSSGIFGTTTTTPALSPADKIATGIGKIGTTLGNSIQSYVNTPPTVKIDPGVSLGILFMSDVPG